MHVAGYIEQLGRVRSKPTVKQHLAAIRILFDWLVTGQVVASNPAHPVRGPKHSVKKGKTSVLDADEMHDLLALDRYRLAARAARSCSDRPDGLHLRPRQCGNRDEGRRFLRAESTGCIRLHEKGGKVTELPCHHNLD